MVNVKRIPSDQQGKGFIPAEYLPSGKDEYYLRNQQFGRSLPWRPLREDEIAVLVANGNRCADWAGVLVCDPFDPGLIQRSEFWGLVRIARLENVLLEYHELEILAGIVDSRIVSCDLGENVAIRNVGHLAHYILGDRVVLLNVGEMHTTSHARFGNGIIKDGEEETSRLCMDLMTEAATRAVMPFDGMTCGDAYLWATYRDDEALMVRLGEITQEQFDSRRGFYGVVGSDCVIKHSRIIKDVRIGPACYIKGANKLKNLTIRSSEQEPTQIGEGVELVNGIVGLGCRIFYGVKAVRFVMGNHSSLKYGARLIHSCLGDNSTISCCEVLSSLIFPGHEQHHNNSFLIASLVMGQSNIAAGATIGSNHNSRAADGELQAGRGFWPGLCVSLKHCSRFASFTLLAKGDYPCELDIPLPFSLVSNDAARDHLVVIPAYWWSYNMYALARNNWKIAARDKRITQLQHIENEALAPDTTEEIISAMSLLELWVGKAHLRARGEWSEAMLPGPIRVAGRERLILPADTLGELTVLGENMEASYRPVIIQKAHKAYHAYRQMLIYYAAGRLVDYLHAHPAATLAAMADELQAPRQQHWVNLGGQLVPEPEAASLIEAIKFGQLASWDAIHARYDALWAAYPLEKQRHAYACLLHVQGVQRLTCELWQRVLDEALHIQEFIRDQVFLTRKKDYDNPFRQITFRNRQEMHAVMGNVGENPFVLQMRAQTDAFREKVAAVRDRKG